MLVPPLVHQEMASYLFLGCGSIMMWICCCCYSTFSFFFRLGLSRRHRVGSKMKNDDNENRWYKFWARGTITFVSNTSSSRSTENEMRGNWFAKLHLRSWSTSGSAGATTRGSPCRRVELEAEHAKRGQALVSCWGWYDHSSLVPHGVETHKTELVSARCNSRS